MRKRVIIIAIGLLLQVIQLFKNRAKSLSKINLLNIVKQLSALSPTQLIKNFDKLQDYGLCVGNAFASQKCQSILNPTKSVIISKLYELNHFQQGIFKKQIRTKRPTFFTLNDNFSSIPILQTISLPTMTSRIIEKYNDAQKTPYLNFFIRMINYFKDLNIPYLKQSYYQERFLPEGASISILGKYKREGSGRICCDKPLFMGTTKNHIVSKLNSYIELLGFQNYILIFGVTFCLGFISKEVYSLCINLKKRKSDPIENYQKLYVKSRVCYNCKQKLSDFIFQNCGHLSMCKQCKDKLKVCGQCQKKGQKGLQIYAC